MSADQSERIAKLEATLLFYANRRNHNGVGVSPVYNDNGRKARLALGECPTCNGVGGKPEREGWVDPNAGCDWIVCPDCRGTCVEGYKGYGVREVSRVA